MDPFLITVWVIRLLFLGLLYLFLFRIARALSPLFGEPRG